MSKDSEHKNHINDSEPENVEIYNQLSRLRDLLKDISLDLSESNAAAKAYATVDTCITLEAVNWQVMQRVNLLMQEIDACNIFPTSKETPCTKEVREATELAYDIQENIPLDIVITPQGETVSAIPNDDNPISQEIIVTGEVTFLRRILTKGFEQMAKITITSDSLSDLELVALPRTFAKYRQTLKTIENQGIKRIFVCEQEDDVYILKEIRVPDTVPSAFEQTVNELFADYEQWHSEKAPITEIEDFEIKELIVRYGRAYQLRHHAEMDSDFSLEQHDKCSDLLKEIRNMDVAYDDIRSKWGAYFELGQTTYTTYGSRDENLPSMRSLILQLEGEDD